MPNPIGHVCYFALGTEKELTHMHSVGRNVKAALVQKGISLTEIARRSGEDVRTVSHVIAGKRTNRAEPVLKEVAIVLEINLDVLMEMYTSTRRVA